MEKKPTGLAILHRKTVCIKFNRNIILIAKWDAAPCMQNYQEHIKMPPVVQGDKWADGPVEAVGLDGQYGLTGNKHGPWWVGHDTGS
ncbi:hypothetical protein Tco_1435801 [Tanacetum coccineum]